MKSGISTRATTMVSALLVLLTSTAASGADAVIGQKLEDLFANKTHKWSESGNEYAAHYEPRGDLMLLINEEIRPSFWRIYGGTSFCLIDRLDDSKLCYEVLTEDETYRLLPRNKPGSGYELEISDGTDTF